MGAVLLVAAQSAFAETTLRFQNSLKYGNSQDQSLYDVEWVSGSVSAAGSGVQGDVLRGLALSYADAASGPPQSTLLWQRQPGSLTSETFFALEVTPGGAYYAGRTWIDESRAGALLCKFDAVRPDKALWTAAPGESKKFHEGAFYAVEAIEEGGRPVVYAAGYASDEKESRVAILVKYDAEGNPLWAKSLGAPGKGNRSCGLAVAALDGFVYVAGYAYHGKKASDFDKASPHVMLWKYAPDGENQWAASETALKVPLSEGPKDADMGLLAADGHVYLVGSKKNGQNTSVLVSKYKPGGEVVWTTEWRSATTKGRPERSFGTSAADGGDRIFVTGWNEYASKDKAPEEDALVLEVDKEYGFVLSGHEYGESKSRERLLGAAAGESGLFAAGRRAEKDADAVIVKYVSMTPKEVLLERVSEDLENGTITIAILSDATFSAPESVDNKSLRFGRTGHEPTWKSSSMKDVSGDGKPDLLCTFKTSFSYEKKTQPSLGKEPPVLSGNLLSGEPVRGNLAKAPPPPPVPSVPEVVEEPVVPEAPAPAPGPAPLLVSASAPPPVPQETALPPASSAPATAEPVPAPAPSLSPTPVPESIQSQPATVAAAPTAAPETAPETATVSAAQAIAALTPQSAPTTAAPVPATLPMNFSLQTLRPEAAKSVSLESSAKVPAAPKTAAPAARAGRELLYSTESRSTGSSVLASRETDPSSPPDPSSRPEGGAGLFKAYFDEGAGAFTKGRFVEAATYFREALSHDPESFEANKLLALALFESGDRRGAENYLRKADSLRPGDKRVQETLALLLDKSRK